MHAPPHLQKKESRAESGVKVENLIVPHWVLNTLIATCVLSIVLFIFFCIYFIIKARKDEREGRNKFRSGLYRENEENEPISLDMINLQHKSAAERIESSNLAKQQMRHSVLGEHLEVEDVIESSMGKTGTRP